ncbi:protein-arginine deiminase type-3-like [Pleurodeles waltl]|uniref:protein-arginine deiminase type-3-like n=1 Tax=Pleurodeles waltl TaxID=8319 RepID=UPI0037099295
MSQRRAIPVSLNSPTQSVCVVGTPATVDIYGSAPLDATTFDIEGSTGVELKVVNRLSNETIQKEAGKWPLDRNLEVSVITTKPSTEPNDIKVNVTYYAKSEKSGPSSAVLHLTSIELSLNVDLHRNGTVSNEKTKKASWTWGPEGHGAVLLVNCDRDNKSSKNMDCVDKSHPCSTDVKDMSPMFLRSRGPGTIFEKYTVALNIAKDEVDKVGVFMERSDADLQYHHILGGSTACYEVSCGGKEETKFYVEGLSFPDVNFLGLVSIKLTLHDKRKQSLPDSAIFTDEVVFRIAPWIMTPNTLTPLEVFVCSVPGNTDFLEQLINLVKKANCKLTICTEADNRGDRWIQDEMEFGYVEAPQKSFPVVFDSPRNGPLQYFPFKHILGPDFGYVTREPEDPKEVNDLDSFGNLEVCPPVTVDGKEYPLGRILIGGKCPINGGLQMSKVVRDFLNAQKVQPPLELWSDWLLVGHIDEFLSFVPAPDRKGFRLLLASPTACYQLFRQKRKDGHGDAVMFEGLEVENLTINEILSDQELKKDSEYVQSCIDKSRDLLKKELGLAEKDIIDIPALFKLGNNLLASAFFPDMVNMLVLGKHLGIPKPFGPIIGGKCCIEEEVRYLLEPLGLECNFIDDFYPYHRHHGEVHCGTNVRRKPFTFKWWNATLN